MAAAHGAAMAVGWAAFRCMAPPWEATTAENEGTRTSTIVSDVGMIVAIDLSTDTIIILRIGTTIIGTAAMASAIRAPADHTGKGLGLEARASATAGAGRQRPTVSGTFKTHSSRRSLIARSATSELHLQDGRAEGRNALARACTQIAGRKLWGRSLFRRCLAGSPKSPDCGLPQALEADKECRYEQDPDKARQHHAAEYGRAD
jgi:hypothetical protein